MTHADVAGTRGLALRERFGLTTIPALVLLDGEGAVLCQNAQESLQEDPTGQHFLWQDTAAPERPLIGFDLVAQSRADVTHLSTPLP